jgi:hypothetical protein
MLRARSVRMREQGAGPSNQRARWVVSECQWGGAMQPAKSFLIRDLLGDVLLSGGYGNRAVW